MAKHDVDDLPQAPWGVAAAYLYTLDLDGPALAWEYLRRNPNYRTDYAAATRRGSAWCERWGLRSCRRSAPGRPRGESPLAFIR